MHQEKCMFLDKSQKFHCGRKCELYENRKLSAIVPYTQKRNAPKPRPRSNKRIRSKKPTFPRKDFKNSAGAPVTRYVVVVHLLHLLYVSQLEGVQGLLKVNNKRDDARLQDPSRLLDIKLQTSISGFHRKGLRVQHLRGLFLVSEKKPHHFHPKNIIRENEHLYLQFTYPRGNEHLHHQFTYLLHLRRNERLNPRNLKEGKSEKNFKKKNPYLRKLF